MWRCAPCPIGSEEKGLRLSAVRCRGRWGLWGCRCACLDRTQHQRGAATESPNSVGKSVVENFDQALSEDLFIATERGSATSSLAKRTAQRREWWEDKWEMTDMV